MASLLLRTDLKAFNSGSTIVIGQTSSVSSVSRRLPVMTFNIGHLAKISSYIERFEEVDEDNIIRASVVRSKFPYNTNAHYGRYKFLLRKFVLKMEEEAAEQGLFLRGNVFPLISKFIDLALYRHPFPPYVREINAYLLDVYDSKALNYVTTTHAAIQTPSSAMLDFDYQLIKVLAELTIVGGMKAAKNAYASSPTTCDMLIRDGFDGFARPMLTEFINPVRGKELEFQVRKKVSGIASLNVEKMVRLFQQFVVPLKITVPIRHLLSMGD